MVNGIIQNESLETWMDTGENCGDVRKGARIEIQALHLAMYDCAILISNILNKDSSDLEKKKIELSIRIKNNFYKNSYLYDGIDDPTIRPNIFIAAYVANDILSKKEWISCFDKALKQIYIEENNKGLITSISNQNELYCENHTGLNNLSYHRGDSWYWVNSLTAIVLNRFGKLKYKDIIKQIMNSNKESITSMGAIGCMPEISSANKVTSQGCPSQAWSYALFIELLYELYSKR